jgi:hypothetical protein
VCIVESNQIVNGFREWQRFADQFIATGGVVYPTGKSMRPAPDRLSSPFRKDILIFRNCKSLVYFRRPVPLEGRIAIVTDAGWDAVDADGAADESA